MRAIGLVGLVLAVACDDSGTKDGAATGDTGATPTTGVGDDDDDDNGGVDVISCTDPFQACGGDAVGAWTVTAVCEVPVDDMGCDGLTVEVTADRSSGTIDIEAGGTYSRSYDIDVDYTLQVPTSCLMGMSCSQLEAVSMGMLSDCTDVTDGCSCAGSAAYTDIASGTWASEGTELVFDGDDRYDYCVSGDQAVSVDQSDGTRVHWQR